MTARELRDLFSNKFGFGQWPPTYEVDAETYGNVCQEILNRALEIQFPDVEAPSFHLKIAVGPNNGLLFKGIELILKK